MPDSFLVVQISEAQTKFSIIDSIENPIIQLGGEEYRVELNGREACYYDWLRPSGGLIFGLKFIAYWNKKIGKKLDPLLGRTKDGEFAIYFDSQRVYDPGCSADQTDWGSKLYSNDRSFLLTFGLAGSTLYKEEVKHIEDIVKNQKK